MKKKPDAELIDKDNPEWTKEDFRRARLAAEALPDIVGQEAATRMLRSRGRPKAAVTKTHVNIRLDADVLKAFKTTGPGWQTRINEALREWLKKRKLDKTSSASENLS
ncbi:MAG: BrnA antitoxin family protein [Thermodesulfobacteriota bacterium]